MQDESYMAFALDLPNPVKLKTPLLILVAARDNMLKPSEIEATARAYQTQFEIIPDVAHNSMLEPRWQTVAERILVWLKERKLKRLKSCGSGRLSPCRAHSAARAPIERGQHRMLLLVRRMHALYR